MSSFGDEWAAAGQQSDDVPDGNYETEIIEASAFSGRADGKRYVKVTLLVRSGDQRGRSFEHFMNWDHPVGRDLAKEALTLYGLDDSNVSTWEEFQRAVADLVRRTANVSKSHNARGYAEVKVNSSQLPLTPQTTQPAPQTAQVASGGDDDIPF